MTAYLAALLLAALGAAVLLAGRRSARAGRLRPSSPGRPAPGWRGLGPRGLRRLRIGRGSGVLEVVDRISLGPKQGVALLRIADRVVAVSQGEGGVRRIAELGADEWSAAVANAASRGSERSRNGPARRGSRAAGAARRRLKGVVGPRLLDAVTARRAMLAVLGAAGAFAGHAPAVALTPHATLAGAVAPAPAPPAAAQGRAAEERAAAELEGGREGAAQEESPANGTAAADPMSPDPAAGVWDALPSLLDESDGRGDLRLGGPIGTALLIGAMALLPTLLLLATGFTRILIVLHLVRQALGTQSVPPAHLLNALALLLTAFLMTPTLNVANATAVDPWLKGEIEQAEMFDRFTVPFREFMLANTGEEELVKFVELRGEEVPELAEDVALTTLTGAFVTSELRRAFQLGFVLFLPFIVIDLVVASVLMSMGMFMLPPVMISLPFKLLLFVLVDGWTLVVGGLLTSFR